MGTAQWVGQADFRLRSRDRGSPPGPCAQRSYSISESVGGEGGGVNALEPKGCLNTKGGETHSPGVFAQACQRETALR